MAELKDKRKKPSKVAVILILTLLSSLGIAGSTLLWNRFKSNQQQNERKVLKQILEKYIDAGQFEEAFSLLNEELRNKPNNKELQQELENILAKKQQYDRQNTDIANPGQDKLLESLLKQNEELQNRTNALWEQLEFFKQNQDGSQKSLQQNQDLDQEIKELRRHLAEVSNTENNKTETNTKKEGKINDLLAKAKSIEKQGNTLENLKDAEDLYRQVLEEDPNQAEALSNLAQNLDEQYRLKEAVDAYQDALEKPEKPFDSELAYLRGIALYRLGRYEEAIESFQTYIGSGGQNQRVYYAMGLSYLQLERETEAKKSFREGIAKGLEHAATYWELSKLELKQKEADEALKYAERALILKRDDSRYLQTKGAAFFELKRYAEAANTYAQAEKSIADDSERGQVNYNLGLSYYSDAQYTKAETAFDKAISLDEDKPEYILSLADTQIASGKTDEAQKTLAGAEKKFPRNTDLLLTQGNIYLKAKQYDLALKVFQKAYEKNPKDRKIINNLGLSYMNTEQFDEARAFFRRAIKRDNENSNLWFNLALVDVTTEQHDEAIRNLEQTVSLNGKLSKAYYLLIKEYLAANRRDRAWDALDRLRRADPKYSKILELETLLNQN